MSNDPCWKGYEQRGIKEKGGDTVPNCVKSDRLAQVSWQADCLSARMDALEQGAKADAGYEILKDPGKDPEGKYWTGAGNPEGAPARWRIRGTTSRTKGPTEVTLKARNHNEAKSLAARRHFFMNMESVVKLD